jgi:hypothetical protein
MTKKSRWQQEYEALPQWARELVDALKPCTGYGGGSDEGIMGQSTKVFFKTRDEASTFMMAVSEAREFTEALSAPFPPPPAPDRERRVFNIVELAPDAEGEDDCAFDQRCCFGHRVEHHAVYCHNEAWPDSPRKCRRNRDDYRHEDCPGFVANPDFRPDEG